MKSKKIVLDGCGYTYDALGSKYQVCGFHISVKCTPPPRNSSPPPYPFPSLRAVILQYVNTADRRAGPPLRRVVRVPYRPLPGQGDDAEPADFAFLEHHVRAHLEPQLRPERDVHVQRGLWNGRTRGILRQVSLFCLRNSLVTLVV